MQAINSPRPTHSDMVLVPTQGRETVQQDLATARTAAEAIRAERVAAMGPDPDCPVPIP
jgi:hypothetical protein